MERKTLMIIALVVLILISLYLMYKGKCPDGQYWCSLGQGQCIPNGVKCIDLTPFTCMGCCKNLDECNKDCKANPQCLMHCPKCGNCKCGNYVHGSANRSAGSSQNGFIDLSMFDGPGNVNFVHG